MKIIVSGLTAAGKTTLCKKLANALELPYFSGSEVLRSTLGSTEEYWSPDLDKERNSLASEREVDLAMVRLLQQCQGGIFDAWGLPWFTTDRALRIWLESDPESRLRKCYVSYIERRQTKTFEECARIVRDKDHKSRAVFEENWGFDLFADRNPFDGLVDCSNLIPSATVDNAKEGASKTYAAVITALLEKGLIGNSTYADACIREPHSSGPEIVVWS